MRRGQKGLGTGLEVRSRYRTWKRMGKGTSIAVKKLIETNKISILYTYYTYIYIIIYTYISKSVYSQLLLCFEGRRTATFWPSGVGADSGSDRCIRCEVRFGCRDCGLK